MALANTQHTFGTVSKTFHWLTALLILTLIPMGLIANALPFETSEQLARKAWLFSLHKTLGVSVFFLACARIAWAFGQPKPGLLHPERRVESLAAHTVHWLLYGSLVLVPLSGWIHHAATTGFAPIWWPFGQALPLVPKSESIAAVFAGGHWVLTKVLALAVALHIAGALKHHVVDKDATLRRMWFGPATGARGTTQVRDARPVVLALALWGAALSVGAALGAYAPHDAPRTAATLEDVQSDWQVQTGTLGLTVTQLGSQVSGSFADWTAAINFDDTVQTGMAGSVDVTIAIGSLTLGGVTEQAMGADYFNVADFPTASFTADIVAGTTGYDAIGTLTIKDQSMPLTLPFTLTLQGDTAQMSAQTDLDRRSFAIGDNMADETSLKFTVGVLIDLTATRAQPAN